MSKIKIDPSSRVGEEHGIYKIISIEPSKSKDNHYLYRGVCKECGYEKVAKYGDFNKDIQNCRHGLKYDIKKCLNCGNEIPIKDLYPSDYNERKFCSHSCVAQYYNQSRHNDEVKYCLNCGEELSKTGQKYCSSKCQNDYEYKEYIKRWKNGEENGMSGKYAVSKRIRKYLMNKYDNKCSRCGWGEINPFTKKIPLEIHHKNGDYTNNDESNLELLCPNCHSLTETYKAANKGRGRKDRKKYYLN